MAHARATKQFNVDLPGDVIDKLKEIAFRNGKTIKQQLIEFVDFWLANNQPKKAKKRPSRAKKPKQEVGTPTDPS